MNIFLAILVLLGVVAFAVLAVWGALILGGLMKPDDTPNYKKGFWP